MSPYEFRYKVDNQSIAELCEESVVNDSKLWQVKQAIKLYLSNKSYKELYKMSCDEKEGFPISYAGVPEFYEKKDLLRFAINMIDGEYSIPDGYIHSTVDVMRIKELPDNEKTSKILY